MKDSISRKQAGVIFRAFKTGSLNATKEQMNWMYERYVSETPSYTTDAKDADIVLKLKEVVDSIFANNMSEANEMFALAISSYKISFNDSIFGQII